MESKQKLYSLIGISLILASLIMQVVCEQGDEREVKELKLTVPLKVALRRGTWSESETGGSRLMMNSHQNVRQSELYYNRQPYRRPHQPTYDDAEDLRVPYNRPARYPNYRPYDPNYDPYYQDPYYPMPYPPYPTTTTTTTTTTTPNPLLPIGFMLMDTYRTPLGGTQIRPLAYYKV